MISSLLVCEWALDTCFVKFEVAMFITSWAIDIRMNISIVQEVLNIATSNYTETCT